MNKRDVMKLLVLNITHLGLIIESLVFKLDVAFPLLMIWTVISLVAHICILKDYAIKVSYEEV